MVNVLNKDQALIQIKWLEKMQHIEITQRCTHGQSVTLPDGPLYISYSQVKKIHSGNEIT